MPYISIESGRLTAGFHRVSRPETESYDCLGETWNCIEMERNCDYVIREIKTNEIPLLTDFLYEAIFQPEDVPKAPRTVLQEPMIWAYVDRFGTRPGDFCRVAVVDGLIIGAAWSRLGCSYGKMDDSTPELAISLYPEYRNKGIGSRLLSSLLKTLQENGYDSVSLSVDKTNYAVRLYRKLGLENATILPGVHIGDGAIIGLGSIVGHDVEPYTIVAGNPARVIRKRFDDELVDLLLRLQWWDRGIAEIQELIPLLTNSDLEHVKTSIKDILKSN